MNTNAYFLILTSASLLAAAAIAGCDTGQEADPYAQEESARDTAPAGETTEPGQTERSMATEQRDTPRQGLDTTRPGTGTAPQMAAGTEGNLTEGEVAGKQVLSQGGDEIGRVTSVVTDQNGENRFAVVEVGEFLGIGEKQVAVEMRHLSLGADGKLQSNLTEDALQSMPAYEPGQYQQDTQDQGNQ